MTNKGSFNDLTNQFNNNINGYGLVKQSVFSKDNPTDAHLPSIGPNTNGSSVIVTNGMRGLSRGGRVSQKSNRPSRGTVGQSKDFQKNGGGTSQPNTAGSQKRQIPSSQIVNQITAVGSTTGNLSSKRSAANQKFQNHNQPIEYVPMQTKSYASQINTDDSLAPGVGGLNILNSGMNSDQSHALTHQTSMNQNVGSRETHMQGSQFSVNAPAMTENSIQDQPSAAFGQLVPKSNSLKFSASKQNLALNSNINGQDKIKLGKTSKYQVKIQQQLESMNQGLSQIRNPKLANGGDLQKFITSQQDGNGAGNANTLEQTRTGANSNTNTRKMSLAAKSGQMQIFNSYSLSQNLNTQGALLNQLALADQKQLQMPNQPNRQGHPNTYHINVKNLHPINQQNNGYSQPQASSGLGHNQIPQLSHLNPNVVPLGTRQYESYLGRRQVIEQQREKKQELLKQLDMGQRYGPQYSGGQSQSSIPQYTEQMMREGGAGDINIQENNYGNDGVSPGTNMLGINSTKHKRNSNYVGQGAHHHNASISSEQGATMQIKSIMQQNSISPVRLSRPSIANSRGPPLPGINPNQMLGSQGVNSLNGKNRFRQPVNPPDDVKLQIQTAQFNNPAFQYANTNPSSAKQVQSQEFSQYLQSQLSPNPNTLQFVNQNEHLQHQVAKEQMVNINYPSQVLTDAQIEAMNSLKQSHTQEKPGQINRITRKLEGGRPHKVYDYMFIQMSNEQFNKEYAGHKIQVIGSDFGQNKDSQVGSQFNRGNGQNLIFQNQYMDSKDKSKFLSPYKSPDKIGQNSKVFQANGMPGQSPKTQQTQEPLNLKGLVQIKAYDSQVTEELPTVQCNLLPTQLDHLKVLICEQDDKSHPKLTLEASNRFEVEKQNQIKQYMEDIIAKLQQKDRRFKVTVKKKFVDDALFNSTSIRVASVYVIVINREKTFDPILNQIVFKSKKRDNGERILDSSSEEDEAEKIAREEYMMRQLNEKGGMKNGKKRSMYDSDTNGGEISTSASSNVQQFKKLMMDKNQMNNMDDKNKKRETNLKKKLTDESLQRYKYQPPVKDYSKYGTTKIRICQNQEAPHQRHSINILFNQYNEFVKLIFKNQKQTTVQKINGQYCHGLARALGMNLKKDAFAEANMKNREHVLFLKEKLIFCFWKKIIEENRDCEPTHNPNLSKALTEQPSNVGAGGSTNSNGDLEIDGETIDSSNANNTPKSKSLANKGESSMSQNESSAVQVVESKQAVPFVFQFPAASITYKYFIGKGNNSIMVRSLMKNRNWWAQNDKEEMERCNYCFTQVKKNSIMDVLPCKFPHKKSGIKNTNQNQTLLATPLQKSSKKKKNVLPNSEKAVNTKGDRLDKESKYDQQKLYNKIEDNFHVNNKKALYLNMKNYYEALEEDVFDNLPLTFHVKAGLEDPEFAKFKNKYHFFEEEIKNRKANKKQRLKDDKEAKEQKKLDKTEGQESPKQQQQSPDKKEEKEKEPTYYQSQVPPKNIWIIKPGENTNRGVGIQVAQKFDEIKDIIHDSTTGNRRTCIVQKYIHNPLLINRRKFDIRTFVLMTSMNGNTKLYIYEEGYLRTSCREYSIHNLGNRLVHLTNDAVQKRAEDYGKFEPGNKLSYNEFQLYIDKNYPDLEICFERDIVSQMNKMTTDVFRACHGKLDPKKRLHTMEVFGLDFMLDDEFKPYLIEVNTNPCLELSCPLLARLIPTMLENALKISLDPTFLPPEHFTSKKAFIGDPCPENRFELAFDSKIDGPPLDKLFQTKDNIIIEMEEDELSDEMHDSEDE